MTYTPVEHKSCYEIIQSSRTRLFPNFDGKDPKVTPWVVLVNGERVEMRNGKSLWKAKNHAHCAVLNNLGNVIYSGNLWFAMKAAKQMWIKENVEIVTLEEWQKRLDE